jgi:hypothetical protein
VIVGSSITASQTEVCATSNQIFRNQREHHRILWLAANQKSLSQNTFTHGAGFFGYPLARNIVDSRYNLNPLQTQLFEAESRDRARCPRRHPMTGSAGSHPVTEIRHLMYAVDEVYSHAAEKPAAVLLENSKAVPLAAL